MTGPAIGEMIFLDWAEFILEASWSNQREKQFTFYA